MPYRAERSSVKLVHQHETGRSIHRSRRYGYEEEPQPHPLDALCENSAMSKDQTAGSNLDKDQLNVIDDLKSEDDSEGNMSATSSTREIIIHRDRSSSPSSLPTRVPLSRQETDDERPVLRERHHRQSLERSRVVGHHRFKEPSPPWRRNNGPSRKPLHPYTMDDEEVVSTSSRSRGDSHSSKRPYENFRPTKSDANSRGDGTTPKEEHQVLSLVRQPAGSSTVDDLLDEVNRLKHENEQLRSGGRATTPPPAVPAFAHQVFYCIDETMYLDEPRWERGDRRPILRSSNPLSRNVDHYLEQHPEVAFVYYKYYDSEAPVNKSKIETKDGVFRTPKPVQQTLCFVSSHMVAAVESLVSEVPDFGEYFPHFDPLDDIQAPYLFMYYSLPFMPDILPELDTLSRNLLQELQKTIDKSHGWEYASAKAKARKGLVARHLVKYLIKPGDVLVAIKGLDTQAYQALKWAEELPPDDDGDREDYEDYDSSRRKITPKRGSKSQNHDGRKKLRYKWKLPVSSWRFDGRFEMHEEVVDVNMKAAYEDQEVPIDQLSIFPLEFAPEDVRNTLEERGRMFWKLRHGKFVSYQLDEEGGLSNIDKRYMVDIETYKKLHPRSNVNRYRLRADIDAREMADPEPPGGNLILLFPPKIAGYNLLRKKWIDLYVDRVTEITWNKQAFKDLVVDEETKVLVQALVTNQLVAEKSTDSISGKGNGLIILLHGAPGTGKTFTAEGVAEFAEKPLFRVTCGDVGTVAETVEQYLQSAFHLGRIWDCVVLLDEADVFLEERDMKDLNRNALVSVFLRALEYHNGILILTSNRVGTFDEAFKSRIQLALHYENLTVSQRRKIWRNFIARLKTFEEPNVDFEDIMDHIDDLSKKDMNGREIRNAITTARQLAQFKGTPFCYSHLNHVIGVSSRFGKYLKDLRDGLTDDELKRDGGLR